MFADPHAIAGLRLSLASPEQIRSWSTGEVTAPETIDYFTGKPHPQGLFSERIFGPTRSGQCFCGRYRHARTPGFRCEFCGVELTNKSVRRERMGHLTLTVPVAHPWFARGTPCLLALLLDLTPRQLHLLLSYSAYVVLDVFEARRQAVLCQSDPQEGLSPGPAAQLATLRVGELLSEEQHRVLCQAYGQTFRDGTGAAAVRALLQALDLEVVAMQLRATISQEPEHPRTKHAIKRLRLIEAVRRSGVDPAWMILEVVPVLPPELRPLVPIGHGRYAASDVNALYKRVIYRNQRVKHFLAVQAPAAILHQECRLLQEACDALFDNARLKPPMRGPHKQPLKSLTDALTGKQGRFRRNLLGKRVDFSGRSVIVGNASLTLQQCGLPAAVCLELFKPFLIGKLIERHHAASVRAAKRFIERTHKYHPLIWDLLAEVMTSKVVLLNRAPTLHRLSIQAFEPVLVEGSAIQLHPCVCSAFNADFDGDQMAVHLPLSSQAQAEARALLLSTHNLRSPASGEPAVSISQEQVLGLFYVSQERLSKTPSGRVFAESTEVQLALDHGVITLHTPIVFRLQEATTVFTSPNHSQIVPARQRIETTAGRLLLNEALPAALRFKNYAMTKERLKELVAECLQCCGTERTAQMIDALKHLGFTHATRSGISFSILADIAVPPEKSVLLAYTDAQVAALEEDVRAGVMTPEERSVHAIAMWTNTTEAISKQVEAALDPFGSLATIIQSGATKARFQQIRQLSGIRGLMASPSGKIIPIPVRGNYLEGLQPWEIFIAGSGARKGFMDRSLNTARSGYLTRRLVEAGYEAWITCWDCGTGEGFLISQQESTALGLADMRPRLLGRVLAEAVPQAHLECGRVLDVQAVDHLLALGVEQVRVRSPLTCEATYGLCQQCYGLDLATGRLVQPGTAVGILAAQSIGEPGTQLTMRTFHSGGIAGAQGDITQGLPRVEELFDARRPKHPACFSAQDGTVSLQTNAQGERTLCVGGAGEPQQVTLSRKQEVLVENGQWVTAGTQLTSGSADPLELLRLRGREGTARYLVNEIQRVYRATGVSIADKHIECIVRQMLRYVQVRHPGDTSLLPTAIMDRFVFTQVNRAIMAQGGQPAEASSLVLGLTKVVLQTRSWLTAASFQETTRVLAEAALRGKTDPLRGYKEALIVGKRIPVRLPEA